MVQFRLFPTESYTAQDSEPLLTPPTRLESFRTMCRVYIVVRIAAFSTPFPKHFTYCIPPSYSSATPTFKALYELPTSSSRCSNMCGRAYYIDGHRYFGSYPRGHVRTTHKQPSRVQLLTHPSLLPYAPPTTAGGLRLLRLRQRLSVRRHQR